MAHSTCDTQLFVCELKHYKSRYFTNTQCCRLLRNVDFFMKLQFRHAKILKMAKILNIKLSKGYYRGAKQNLCVDQ